MRILKYIREKKQIVCCLFSNEVDGFSEVIKEILLQQVIINQILNTRTLFSISLWFVSFILYIIISQLKKSVALS